MLRILTIYGVLLTKTLKMIQSTNNFPLIKIIAFDRILNWKFKYSYNTYLKPIILNLQSGIYPYISTKYEQGHSINFCLSFLFTLLFIAY